MIVNLKPEAKVIAKNEFTIFFNYLVIRKDKLYKVLLNSCKK